MIIDKIEQIEDFICVINIIILKEEINKNAYIDLIIKKYDDFKEEKLTEESFINLIKKIIEYNPEKKLNQLEHFLPKFKQKYNIYLQILEVFKEDDEIKREISILSIKHLELPNLIDLIKKLNEEQKKFYFDNLDKNIITYEDFLEIEISKNLRLLTEFMKNKLIPESIYLENNKDVLEKIYDKLIVYDEKREIYIKLIKNEKEYSRRFILFKLIKGDEFKPELEFAKMKKNYLDFENDLNNAKQISVLLNKYYNNTEIYKKEINKIDNIYKNYTEEKNKANLWLNDENKLYVNNGFIKNYKSKANIISKIEKIKLFEIIYNDFCEGDQITKFDKAIQLLDDCKVIFEDIQKGNPEILGKWQNKFKRDSGIDDELTNLKDYYKIENKEGLDKIAKNILIFTKKNTYKSDINCILYILKQFEAQETNLSKFLTQKQEEFKLKENIDFEVLVEINNCLEKEEIYINNGKDDSSLIKLIRLLYDKDDAIDFIKGKEADTAQALLTRLSPTSGNLKFNDILEYQSCIAFITDINTKMNDEELLNKLKEKIKNDDINKIILTFKNYFANYGRIKILETNFDNSVDTYENIKAILNNSEFRILFFKREFKVYDDNKNVKDIIAKDLDGLIQIKDNINLNYDIPEDSKVSKIKKELLEKKERIENFVRYTEQLQNIIKYFKKLENKGCPFFIDITIKALKDKVTFILVDEPIKYNYLIFLLREYSNTIAEFQSKFYKENEYFRYVYDRQLYRLFKRTTSRNEDISSYIRFFTNGDSIKDTLPSFISKIGDQTKAYKVYREAIEENYQLISKYIENIFYINNTSLDNLYKDIKVKNDLKGLYKCNIKKYNMDIFIIKIFLKLTGTFPIAQNILLTNKETSTGEIYSFTYRAMKCRFDTLFIISISDDFSVLNLNQMTSLLNKIINEMKAQKTIKEITDLKPCILFLTQNSAYSADFPEAKDLPESIKGDENKLEYELGKEGSTNSGKTLQNIIYDSVRVYTSDCSGLGKSYLIKKEIKKNGDDYHYFGVGDDITKDDLFIKLEDFIKYKIKGKPHVGVHLDLFYTKNTPLMKYFLFAILITKLYQTNDNILYIPKNINIYVEIPNGPQQFLDDYPILTLFKRTNITYEKIISENSKLVLQKTLSWDDKEINIEDNFMTCIEKKNYLNILNYLSSKISDEDKNKYGEKIQQAAFGIVKCIYSQKLRQKDVSQKNLTEKEKKEYIVNFFDFDEQKALEIQDFPLIFRTKNGYVEIDLSNKEVNNKDIKYFLTNLKKVMSLDESEEEMINLLGDYKITEDNYKKMMLILFRIFANIPVILMGETGCGKTELIKQLMKMLNKDKEKKGNNFIIKNMHSGVKENEIKEVIEKAEKNLEESKNDMVCIFFDEINTTSLLSKMKEIFVNHKLDGETIDERIRFIGACNPFRKNKEEEGDEGLKLDSSNDEEEMAYMVNPLPNSLLNYIFYFKSLDDHDVIKYIESIIDKEFPESENSILIKIAIETIYSKINDDEELKNRLTNIIGKEFPKEGNNELETKKLIERIIQKILYGEKNEDNEENIKKEREEGKVNEQSKHQNNDKVNYQKQEEEKNYLEDKIGNKFPEIENSILRKNVINAIYYSHKFVRKINGTSSVSLRDLQRFRRAYKFFNDYYKYKVEYLINKNEKISDKFKIKSKVESFVLSLFITYYIKIFKPGNKMFYLEAINDFVTNLAYKFTINEWYEDDNWNKEPFNTIVRNEQDFLLKEMEVEKVKGIGLNNSLKENIFLMFFSIYSYIPLIVVGKPGCSKSLSIQLINRFMRGELSDSNFLKNFPTINNTSFQGSENNTPESIENIFNEAEKKIDLTQIKMPESIENLFKDAEEQLIKKFEGIVSIYEISNKIDEKIKNNSKSYEHFKTIFEEEKKNLESREKDQLDFIEKIFNEIEKKSDNILKDEKKKIDEEKEKSESKQLNELEFTKKIINDIEKNIKKIFNRSKEKILDNPKNSKLIKQIFKEAKNELLSKNKYLSLLVFDELGLSERSPTNCLKVLHSKLEMTLDPDERKKISFVGISNWRLDAAKMNRAIFLAIPEILLPDVLKTVKAIADSYDETLYDRYKAKYEDLGKKYFNYKDKLREEFGEDKDKLKKESKSELNKQKKKSDEYIVNYHGGRDLYNLIKIFSSDIINSNKPDDSNKIDEIANKAIARNLSGLEINGESSLKKYIEGIKIDEKKIMDLVKDNIASKDTRFLLLASEKSMFGFLIDIIKKEIENHVVYIGSPFKGDRMNISYQTEMIVKIENSVAEGKVIILSDLDQIYSIFYDLFNQNYINYGAKKYCRISHGPNIQKLAFVNDNTKFIILVDKNNLRKQKLPFLSRFEKHIITFDTILGEDEKNKSNKINSILEKLVSVKDINYNLDNILVNTNKDIINGYIYLYKDKDKNSYSEIIKDKVIPILPQDIIFTLPLSDLKNETHEFDSLTRDIMDSNKKYNSLEEYLKSDNRGKEDILIVYTFSNTGEAIKLSDKENYMERITTEINNVYKFKQILNEFYEIENYQSTTPEKEKYQALILKFESETAKYINFFISEINNYKEVNNKKFQHRNKKFIFTINIKRDFNKNKNNNKVTTVLVVDEKINQLFIDNINGTQYSIKDKEKINIDNYMKEPRKLILEEMLKFYLEYKTEHIGNYKGIDTNNFIREFKSFFDNSEKQDDTNFIENYKKNTEQIIRYILVLISKQINNNDNKNIIDSIIKNKSINQNTIDFITAMTTHIKKIFNENIKQILLKTENNNFFTTLFMLNVKEKENVNSTNQINDYSFKIKDTDILNNKIISNIITGFIDMLKENKIDSDFTINIKINYKIPGFFNIYKEIKTYIEKEKLSFFYRQDETELRKCQFDLKSTLMGKLINDIKDFNIKLYTEFTSKQLVSKIVETKITDKNYLEFSELFLNEYITFYLENLYNNNVINNFVINDIPHKLILLLLDFKFKGLKKLISNFEINKKTDNDEKNESDENDNTSLQNVIAKILWLEANSKYIKNIIDLYNIISKYIFYDEKEKDYLFKQILNYISKNEIKYVTKEEDDHLKLVNVPFYKILKLLFNSIVSEQAIKIAASKNINDNYYSYFKQLENCLKELQKISKILKIDIIELSILKEFIDIYNVFEQAGKVTNLDINILISNLIKSLEIIERNGSNKIDLLKENLKELIKMIKPALYDTSKLNEIKGDTIYYELIENIFINELKRENNQEYKIYILKEFLLEDSKLFIQSNRLLKIILEDFVSSDTTKFQMSFDNLSNKKLETLEKNSNNDWIKETLIYTFEYISIIYIQNLIIENENSKDTKNILIKISSVFQRYLEFLEKLYIEKSKKSNKDGISNNEITMLEQEMNNNLQIILAIAFIRVYLKTFVDWIDKNKIKPLDIEEIIKIINGNEGNIAIPFRDMIQYFIYKIIYNLNEKDIEQLFNEQTIEKFHLESYSNFEYLKKEKDIIKSPKDILFMEVYKKEDKELKAYNDEFDKLSSSLSNNGNGISELKDLIEKNELDIFYSVFSTKISPHLSSNMTNNDKIKILSDFIEDNFYSKEKLLNIFKLFLDKSKYNKSEINLNRAEILQFCLRYCINSDEISRSFDNIYYPLYEDNPNITSYIPGNDLKERKIYYTYIQIKNYLLSNPYYHGVYVCICNIHKDNEDIYVKMEESDSGYPKESNEKCKYCGKPVGKDAEPKSFCERDYYFRICKNDEDKKMILKEKVKGNCITLDEFYKKYISKKIEEDSKGINISSKKFFDIPDKPIRNQSQIAFRLMNMILYSHLFTNVLFNDKPELFTDGKRTYLDYIVNNWDKLEDLLKEKSINNIFVFMNLIYKDLLGYLNNQKIINDYDKLLEIEKEIENIIDNKINKKTEKVKEKYYSKYEIFQLFYNKNKNNFREKDSDSITALIKEINGVENYKDESKYPYYKNFLYSDYPDNKFYKENLEKKDKEKYPVINIFLQKNNNKNEFGEEFGCFNFVIKSLINQYLGVITEEEAKKQPFKNSNVYKRYQKESELFIKIMNKKYNELQLTEDSSLANYFKDEKYINLYKEYAKNQNSSLKEIIDKINAVNYDCLECQEINIQEAQKDDLLTLEFENESESQEIFLMNTSKEIYGSNSKIKYNNYNLYSVNFDNIERILVDKLIRNACFFKTDEIVEMKYSGKDYLNDGIYELNKIKDMNQEEMDEKDKIGFLIYYEKKLKDNLPSCLEINGSLKNIIAYVLKNNKKINKNESIYNVIEGGGFPYRESINKDFKEFMKDNQNIKVTKLSSLFKYLEMLYFELAMKDTSEFKEKLNDEIKERINKYYSGKTGELITKGTLSNIIIKFILNIKMSQKIEVIQMDDNLFFYLNNKYLWTEDIYQDKRFSKECEDYINLNILVKNAYDFYSTISFDSKAMFEKDNDEILKKIKTAEEEKARKDKEIKRENERKIIEQINNTQEEDTPKQENVDIDEDDLDDLDNY